MAGRGGHGGVLGGNRSSPCRRTFGGTNQTQSAHLVGRTVFLTRGWIACHQGPGVNGGNVEPNLTAVSKVAEDRVPGLNAGDYARQSIRDPRAFVVPGFSPLMPALGLSDDEIEAVVSFQLGSPLP